MLTEPVEPSYHRRSKPEEVDLPTTEPALHDHSDVREFLVLVRRHILLIVVVAVATALAAFVVSVKQPKQYTAETTLLYTPPISASGIPPDVPTALDTIVGIGTSSNVLAPIARSYHLTLRQMRQAVSLNASSTAQLLTLSAKAKLAPEASSIANRLSSALIAYRSTGQKSLLNAQATFLQQQLQTFAGKTEPSAVAAASDVRTQLVEVRAELAVFNPDLSVLTPATTPTAASSPHPSRNAAIGLFVGLALGLLLGALRDRLDRRTHGVDEVEAVYRAPMLGMVPFTKRRANRADLLADFSVAGPLADAYRTIRTNLSLFQLNDSAKSVIVVTSAVAAEGKSAVAANLAHALSVTGKQVLAVSADLHRPTLHEYFGVPSGEGNNDSTIQMLPRTGQTRGNAGLVQVLAGDVTLADAVRLIPLSARERANGGSLALLANSTTFFDPAALFSSGQMQRFLRLARQRYDVVVLDTPPLLVNADAALLAQGADMVVMVARLKHLTRNQARRAVRIMAATHITPTGLIVTGDVEDPGYGYAASYDFDDSNENGATSSGADIERPARSRA